MLELLVLAAVTLEMVLNAVRVVDAELTEGCLALSEDDEDDEGSLREEELANSYSVRCGDGCGDDATSGTGFVGDREGFTKDVHLKED